MLKEVDNETVNPNDWFSEEETKDLAKILSQLAQHKDNEELQAEYKQLVKEGLDMLHDCTKTVMTVGLMAKVMRDQDTFNAIFRHGTVLLSSLTPTFVYAGVDPNVTKEDEAAGFHPAFATGGQSSKMKMNEQALTLVTMLANIFAQVFGSKDYPGSQEQLGYDILAHGMGYDVYKNNDATRDEKGVRRFGKEVIDDYLNTTDTVAMNTYPHRLRDVFGSDYQKQIKDWEDAREGKRPYKSADGKMKAFTLDTESEEDFNIIKQAMDEVFSGKSYNDLDNSAKLREADIPDTSKRVVKDILDSVDLDHSEVITKTKEGKEIKGIRLTDGQKQALLMALGVPLDKINLEEVHFAVADRDALNVLAAEGEEGGLGLEERSLDVDENEKEDK